LYNSVTDSFTSLPVQGASVGAVNPAGTQIAVVTESNVQFFDGNASPVASVSVPTPAALYGIAGVTYSPDGRLLYFVQSSPSLPLVYTVDATAFQLVGNSQSFLSAASGPGTNGIGYAQSVDSSGLLFEVANHGVAIVDATNIQNFGPTVFGGGAST